MTVTLKPDLEKRVAERVDRGDYDSPDSLVSEAVEWLLSDEENEGSDVTAAVKESIEQIERGESIGLAEFDAAMRRKYEIPR